jgi:hypothetical protein
VKNTKLESSHLSAPGASNQSGSQQGKLRIKNIRIDFLFLFNNQPDALIIQIYSVRKLYMFRAYSLPIIRSFLLYLVSFMQVFDGRRMYSRKLLMMGREDV